MESLNLLDINKQMFQEQFTETYYAAWKTERNKKTLSESEAPMQQRNRDWLYSLTINLHCQHTTMWLFSDGNERKSITPDAEESAFLWVGLLCGTLASGLPPSPIKRKAQIIHSYLEADTCVVITGGKIYGLADTFKQQLSAAPISMDNCEGW